MVYYISLTFRPVSLMTTAKDFKKYLKTIGVVRYFIGEETGKNSTNITHFQCYLESDTRGDNLRNKLIDKYEIKDAKHAIVQRTIHEDAREYTLGYCQKELHNYVSNIPDDELTKAFKYYEDNREKYEKKNRKYKEFTLDNIGNDLIDLHIADECKEWNEKIYVDYIRANKKNIGFQLFSRINKMKLEEYVQIHL